MAENPCDNIDNELPEPVPCRITIRTSQGEMPLDEAYPDLETWTEIDRDTQTVTIGDGGCEIDVERITRIEFRRGSTEGEGEKRVELVFTGWES